ncbi:hypothetical protein HN371_09715 [Candidatus Poribacteria bacterium]|jgi:hypothetical protein|nr:hypothetical protein [Candidatus Poribacteria bacterium]MBT5714915.1 hypothetical protein [Candidatus Poribacteria bacterium]MBT7097774.1 hypothetical protein [Candidatus Poribacteria bacterium]MBT7809693.1 hypothetical protein [Candidatus Poribacteria bacterium]
MHADPKNVDDARARFCTRAPGPLRLVACGLALGIVLFAAHADARVLRVPDEYASPQAAVDEAGAGDIVSVAEGVYEPPRMTESDVTLMGSGVGTVFIQEIDIRGVDGIVLTGLRVRGGTNDHHFGIACEDANDIVIRDVAIDGFHHGISASGSTVRIAGCEVKDAFNVALLVTQDSAVRVEDTVAGADSAIGMLVTECPRLTEVRRSEIRGTLLVGLRAANANVTVRDTRIEGNPVGVDVVSGHVDLGRSDDPGRNVFLANDVLDVLAARRVNVQASGCYWGRGGRPGADRVSPTVEVFPWLASDPAGARPVSSRSRLATNWARLKTRGPQ